MTATAATLADKWQEYVCVADATRARRDYMAGALSALLLLKGGATHEQLMAEVVMFGRAIGTAAERATERVL